MLVGKTFSYFFWRGVGALMLKGIVKPCEAFGVGGCRAAPHSIMYTTAYDRGLAVACQRGSARRARWGYPILVVS